MADERQRDMERMVSFRMREADYQALMRLVASDLYASPSHAMRRAITLTCFWVARARCTASTVAISGRSVAGVASGDQPVDTWPTRNCNSDIVISRIGNRRAALSRPNNVSRPSSSITIQVDPDQVAAVDRLAAFRRTIALRSCVSARSRFGLGNSRCPAILMQSVSHDRPPASAVAPRDSAGTGIGPAGASSGTRPTRRTPVGVSHEPLCIHLAVPFPCLAGHERQPRSCSAPSATG